jgi:hypothetical protein
MKIVVEWEEKQLRLSQLASEAMKESSEKMGPDITAI